ncbi:MAG TPA: hypothetical protein VNQ33_09150, partial [Acidimicrobiales bacterium]|nr:hypothetical protein [Acidimicrobiales bacterium]
MLVLLLVASVLPVAVVVLGGGVPAGAVDDFGVLSTLAGSGAVGQADGAAGSASFDSLVDLAATYDGRYLYVLEVSSGGSRENMIRKVDTGDGSVSTFVTESEAPALQAPKSIQVDRFGQVWVSVSISAAEKGIVRFDEPHSSGTVVMSGLCCGFDGTALVGDGFKPAGFYLYYSHAGPDDGHGHRFNELYRIPLDDLPASGDDGEALGGPGSFTRSQVKDMEFGADDRLYLAWDGTGGGQQLWRFDGPGSFTRLDDDFSDRNRIAFARGSSSMYHLCFWWCPTATGGEGRHELLRRDGFGDSAETRIAGEWMGYDEGSPGMMGVPVGLALSPQGTVAWIADQGNHRIRRVGLPEDPNR